MSVNFLRPNIHPANVFQGPVEDVSSSDITCNKGATAAPISAPVTAGSDVSFFWTTWPESHRGPAMTYMAKCPGSCSDADPTTLSFFKIDEAGLNADGTWASDDLIANNGTYTSTIPSDIAPGNYIIRHELLALHSAGTSGGAQFYPMCANVEVTGSGTANPAGVKFPGAYAASDEGILVNIYNNPTSYVIPGPAVYGGGASADPTTSAAPVTTSAAAPTTSAAETVVPEPTTVVPEPTTAPAEPISSSIAVPTFVPVPTTAAAPISTLSATSFATVTRPATTSIAAAPTATKAPGKQTMNECLDAVNACIRSMQSQNGGVVDFSSCEQQRQVCYTL